MPARSVKFLSFFFLLLSFTRCAKLSLPTPPTDSSTVASTVPTLSSVSISSGSASGGTTLVLTGTGFRRGLTVVVGGSACLSLAILSDTQITCTTTSHSAGTVDIVVTNPDSNATTLASSFTYVPAPTVTSVTANSGSTTGGTSVTVAGTGFLAGATVDFGGTACGTVNVTNSTTITCTTGAHAAGAVTVSVTNTDTQSGSANNAYTYVVITNPTVSSITPSSGVLTGGMFVELAGTGFQAGASVAIGGSSCTSVNVVSSTKLTCTTGSRAAATVDVVVTNADTGTGTLTNGFTYGTNSFHVERVYPTYNGSIDSWNWNYYVDGGTTTNDCDAATSTTCIHAGEKRKVVTGRASCTGLTMTDNLGVFSWTCAVTNSIATFTTSGFNSGKGLAHLLDAADFKNNYVVLTDGGAINGTNAKWWNNTVGALPAAVTVQTLSTAGKIYTLSASDTGNGYYVAADRIGVVTLPGVTLTWGDSATNNCHNTNGSTTGANGRCIVSVGKGADTSRNFAWVEGTFDGNAATNDAQYGVLLAGAKFSRLNLLSSSYNTFYGIALAGASYNKILNVTGENNGTYGIHLDSSSYNSLQGVNASYNPSGGINLYGSSNNTLHQMRASNNAAAGVYLRASSNDNILTQTMSFASAYGVYIYGSSNNVMVQTTSANSTSGVAFYDSSVRNTLIQTTTSNHSSYGVYFGLSSSNNRLVQTVASNSGYGLALYSGSNNNNLTKSAIANNGLYGIYLDDSDDSTFVSDLLLGNNSWGNCEVAATSDNSNLAEGGAQSCTTTDPGLSITASVSLADSFRGLAIDGDTQNAHDLDIDAGNGVVSFGSITDWIKFENVFRGWGKHANNSPINSGNRDQCTAGNCGLWDWSLAAGDTGAGGSAVLLDRTSCPTGTIYATHTWSNSSTSNYLLYAMEQLSDSIGNDNGLCESGETCIYSPNIGAYQGHGTLAASSGISGCNDIGTGGTITNVTLLEYPTNGY